ncbi:MAG: hypothetical protein HRT44_04740, partial [Bdellovibrionales bacterium]|nr:hypothetical protein [Bdellovibrionales bacterium]NQZ18550.1 hypothetical protein [Bdellovibrionales bacterium]
INWCEALKRGEKTNENVAFFQLFEQVLGHTQKLADVEEAFNNGTLLFAHLPLYYEDKYDRTMGAISWEIHEVNDRFRTEILPILQMSKQMISIAERLDQEYPSLLPPLSVAKSYYSEFERLKQDYLGLQMSISDRMGDCPQVAGRESRRRVRSVAFSEVEYQSKIVQPLMSAAMAGEITVDEANALLKSIHEDHEGFIDSIVVMNEDVAAYKSSQLSFVMRMRLYLIKGVSFSHPITGNVEIPPIVGDSLEIVLPNNILSEQGRNPYFNGNGNLRPWREFSYYKGDTAQDYAESTIAQLMDEMGGGFSLYRFTKVDRSESHKFFELDSKRVEFMVQKMLMNGETYTDYNNPACRNSGEELDAECIKTVSASVDQLADLMHEIFRNIEIDDEIEEYMRLVAYRGYVGRDSIGVQVRFSDAIAEHPDSDYAQKILPYKDVGGFFDLAVDYLKSPHLGFLGATEYESYLISNSEHGGFTCYGVRDGCYWEDSKSRAKQFFLARKKRPGLLFKFDKEILVEGYENRKKEAKLNFDFMYEIEERGQALIEERRPGQLEYFYDMNRPKMDLFPLSTNRTNNKYDFDRFFLEETESFFLEDPQWDKYLMN